MEVGVDKADATATRRYCAQVGLGAHGLAPGTISNDVIKSK
jgi:hypothetical protein